MQRKHLMVDDDAHKKIMKYSNNFRNISDAIRNLFEKEQLCREHKKKIDAQTIDIKNKDAKLLDKKKENGVKNDGEKK